MGPKALTCVWDTSALLHAARASRLDVLGDFVKGTSEHPWNHYIPATVAEELAQLGAAPPDWASVVHVDGLSEIVAFGEWSQRLVAGPHHRGEAAVAAWAQSHAATAVIDDNDARLVAQQHGLDAHGSIWVLCQAISCAVICVYTATSYCDAVISHGARMPFEVGGFEAWVRRQGLIR
ncbi:hypothetical protein [Pseudonocardia yunnanensis]|uniref:PIN domain-containing protein n=1 Tax=Pseudonocardia yunnanensis TaxID=58107 RepID=A0ABW4ETU2_9PSEU